MLNGNAPKMYLVMFFNFSSLLSMSGCFFFFGKYLTINSFFRILLPGLACQSGKASVCRSIGCKREQAAFDDMIIRFHVASSSRVNPSSLKSPMHVVKHLLSNTCLQADLVLGTSIMQHWPNSTEAKESQLTILMHFTILICTAYNVWLHIFVDQ